MIEVDRPLYTDVVNFASLNESGGIPKQLISGIFLICLAGCCIFILPCVIFCCTRNRKGTKHLASSEIEAENKEIDENSTDMESSPRTTNKSSSTTNENQEEKENITELEDTPKGDTNELKQNTMIEVPQSRDTMIELQSITPVVSDSNNGVQEIDDDDDDNNEKKQNTE